jgi:transcriptional regulator with XRE-family HTH domain
MKDIQNFIGQKLKQIRRLKNVTQKELGDFLNFSEAQISLIESGKRKLSVEDIYKVAKFFDVSHDYFLEQRNSFINFRHDNKIDQTTDIETDAIIKDFRNFIIKKIHDDKKKS